MQVRRLKKRTGKRRDVRIGTRRGKRKRPTTEGGGKCVNREVITHNGATVAITGVLSASDTFRKILATPPTPQTSSPSFLLEC